MGAYGGPNIDNIGLEFCVDSADRVSYYSGSTTWSAVGYEPMALVTRTSSATGGSVLGMGHTFTSSFTPPSTFNYVAGNIYTCFGPTSTGCTIIKSDGTNVSSDTFFRILVFRYPLPS